MINFGEDTQLTWGGNELVVQLPGQGRLEGAKSHAGPLFDIREITTFDQDTALDIGVVLIQAAFDELDEGMIEMVTGTPVTNEEYALMAGFFGEEWIFEHTGDRMLRMAEEPTTELALSALFLLHPTSHFNGSTDPMDMLDFTERH